MALKTKEKTKIIQDVKINDKDTGSSEVQVALISEQIEKLTLHLKKHPNDVHSRKGLVTMVMDRKKLLTYLKSDNEKRYNALTKKLGLKK
jgi:small subunit ribosomal protein S15